MGKTADESRHIEWERKFDVPADLGDAAAPSFDGLSMVDSAERQPTRWLEAIYFDTPAHDLARHRVTLRRRTGGPDEGWHLKLPGADSEARTEIRAPLHPDLPDALRDAVLAIVRDRPIVAVARIDTARDVTTLFGAGGAEVAEFCDDRVSACRLRDGESGESTQWREWELELVDAAMPDGEGLLDRLTNRLLDAGAIPSGHSSKLAKTLGEIALPEVPADPMHRAVAAQIERLLESDRAVRFDADDAVHQMRVATRQIRSLLQASEEAFGLTDDAWILHELRELAAVLGAARDAEVLAERYREALHGLPADLIRGPVADRLVDGAWRRYQAGLRRSLTAMRSQRYFRLLDALDTLVVSAAPVADSGQRPISVRSSFRKVRKAAKAAKAAYTAGPAEHDEAVHRIRKAAKRLRYIAAATGHTGIERRSKAIQTLLGDHQDSVVSREHLLAAAADAHAAGEDTFTYGVLYQREAEVALYCEDQLGDALKVLRRAVD
jgi:CHAD domain-containing protein